jgi:hypothetical protein
MARHWLIPRDFLLVNKYWLKGDISPLRKLLACVSVGQFLRALMHGLFAESKQAEQFFVIVNDAESTIKPLHSVVLLANDLDRL